MSDIPGITPGKGIEFTLPSRWYLDDDIFQLEREHIFLKEWYCVGREEQWPQPGDHKVLDVLGESILLVRNQAGVLKAFYNVCVHRGSRICAADDACETADRVPLKGGVVGGKVITCPYHAWSYDLDGQLISAPHMPAESGFDSQVIHLHPVLVETYGGFVFVNMTPETAPSFEDHVEGLKKNFSRYPLGELRIGKTIHYDIDANWKVLCENYNECYHCGHVHPELCKIVPAFKEQGGAKLEWERGIAHREGADTFTTTGTTPRRAFPTLNEDEQTRHKGDLLYPNMFLSMAKDHVAAFVLSPQGAGRTLVDCHFLFEPYELEKPDFDGSDAYDIWHLVNRQDWSICERVQLGMSAQVHRRGIFSPMEDSNLDIRKYVTDRIGDYVAAE
jgi:Rieske 2Fe-2S family protein